MCSCMVCNKLHAFFVFGQARSFLNQIDIVEAVIFCSNLSHEFKSCIHFILSPLNGISTCIPRMYNGTWTKGIAPGATEGMPIGDRKFKMLLHGLPGNHTVGVVVAESKGVVTFFSFKLNLSDGWKK